MKSRIKKYSYLTLSVFFLLASFMCVKFFFDIDKITRIVGVVESYECSESRSVWHHQIRLKDGRELGSSFSSNGMSCGVVPNIRKGETLTLHVAKNDLLLGVRRGDRDVIGLNKAVWQKKGDALFMLAFTLFSSILFFVFFRREKRGKHSQQARSLD